MVRVRQKKINPKSNLPILREADTAGFDPEDVERGIDAYTGLPKIESGVESKEEKVSSFRSCFASRDFSLFSFSFCFVSFASPARAPVCVVDHGRPHMLT